MLHFLSSWLLQTRKGSIFMDKTKEWNEFFINLLTCTLTSLKATKEYKYQNQRQEQIDEMLANMLTKDQKVFVEEALFELGLHSDEQASMLYQQGFKDCVWLLKKLGVLA